MHRKGVFKAVVQSTCLRLARTTLDPSRYAAKVRFFRQKFLDRGYPLSIVRSAETCVDFQMESGSARRGVRVEKSRPENVQKRLVLTTSSTTNETLMRSFLKDINPLLRSKGVEAGLAFRIQSSIFRKHYADNWNF